MSRYVDMKIMTGGVAPEHAGVSQMDAMIAQLAAKGYVRQQDGPVQRKVQEIAGLIVPVAYLPCATAPTQSWALVREDVFDVCVIRELQERETRIQEQQEVIVMLAQPHRAVVPDNNYGKPEREERAVCGGGGSTAATFQEGIQG